MVMVKPHGVDLLVDGFQLGGISDGGLLFLQGLDGLLGFGMLLSID